jgi:predicted nucleotidyltransferase
MNAAVAEDTIDRAGRALIDAAPASAKVILFGSRARGDAYDRSDFDFLVIERDVADRFAETARLGRVLGRLLIPADVVVVSERYAEKWASVRGTLVHEAMSRGTSIGSATSAARRGSSSSWRSGSAEAWLAAPGLGINPAPG